MLRRATEADAKAYTSLDARLQSRIYAAITTTEGFLKELQKGPVYMVELPQGGVVGMVSYVTEPDQSVYISGLAVDPACHGRGIGREAMTHVLAEVQGAPRVYLLTHPENVAAVGLYTSLGFVRTGRKENVFGDGEPRIELTLKR